VHDDRPDPLLRRRPREVVGEQVEGRVRAGRVAADRQPCGVAADGAGDAQRPVERGAQVVQAEVGPRRRRRRREREEAEEVEAVGGPDDDGAREPRAQQRDGRAGVGGAELQETTVWGPGGQMARGTTGDIRM
jgi:hypothetical protein